MTSKKTIRNSKHVNYYQLAVDFENKIVTLTNQLTDSIKLVL